MRHDAQTRGVHTEVSERVPPVFAVHDDTLEAAKELAPEAGAPRCPPGKQVVRGEHRGSMRPEQAHVELRRGEPLQVEYVGLAAAQRREAEGMLCRLERQPQRRALEDPGGQGIEELAAHVAVRRRNLAEAEPGRDELGLRARVCEGRGELVVVRRRERRWICEEDAHVQP